MQSSVPGGATCPTWQLVQQQTGQQRPSGAAAAVSARTSWSVLWQTDQHTLCTISHAHGMEEGRGTSFSAQRAAK
ncbi:hypothetical protein HaLaN_30886 [Haematococcus lacustris]|uniref:Uncharacterized protein n=1 Tax=Haematococcus lacustris TaxID=44745 RepID=A0A6A0AGQ6_HAELA|nr:hypothetical protein HaLaN_30886 [Haematococcus lacustris]